MNPLNPADFNIGSIITNAKLRDGIYATFALIGIGLLGAQQAYAHLISIEVVSSLPVWLSTSLSVYPVLATAGFAVAKANTPTPSKF